MKSKSRAKEPPSVGQSEVFMLSAIPKLPRASPPEQCVRGSKLRTTTSRVCMTRGEKKNGSAVISGLSKSARARRLLNLMGIASAGAL